MRGHQSICVILSAVAGLAAAQDFNAVPTCAQPCFGEMKLQAVSLGCANDADLPCLCTKTGFRDGLKSCSEPKCTAVPGAVDQLLSYANQVCVNAGVPASTASVAPTPTSTPPASSVTPTSSPPSQPPSASSSSTPTAVSATTGTALSSTTSSASAATHSSGSSSSATSSGASSSSTVAAGSSNSTSTATSNEGLSQATKIGIGIGGGAAALGLIGVAACIILHKRGSNRSNSSSGVRSLTISDPMPGSGRSYAGDHHTEKYSVGMSDLEFKSRRYEDMLPRQSPRNMV